MKAALSGHKATLRLEAGPNRSEESPPYAEVKTRAGDFHVTYRHRQTKLFGSL